MMSGVKIGEEKIGRMQNGHGQQRRVNGTRVTRTMRRVRNGQVKDGMMDGGTDGAMTMAGRMNMRVVNGATTGRRRRIRIRRNVVFLMMTLSSLIGPHLCQERKPGQMHQTSSTRNNQLMPLQPIYVVLHKVTSRSLNKTCLRSHQKDRKSSNNKISSEGIRMWAPNRWQGQSSGIRMISMSAMWQVKKV